MTATHYRVPITGTVRDWITFSGDPDDPVRPVGIREIAGPGDEVSYSVVELDIEDGTALVEVEAEAAFHERLAASLADTTPAEVAARHSVKHLKRGSRQRPEVSLKFRGA